MTAFFRAERRNLESFLSKSSGYVLNFGAATALAAFLLETHRETKP